MAKQISIANVLTRARNLNSSIPTTNYPLYNNYNESYNYNNILESVRKWNSYSREESININKMVELLETVAEQGTESQLVSISNIIAENVSCIKDVKYLHSITKDNHIISEAVEDTLVYDKIIDNHNILSKRFNIDSNIRSATVDDMPVAIFDMCSFIDTYKYGIDTKINLSLGEAVYVLAKNGISYPMESIVEDVSTYFMTQKKSNDKYNMLLDILESTIDCNALITEADCSFIKQYREMSDEAIIEENYDSVFIETNSLDSIDKKFKESKDKSSIVKTVAEAIKNTDKNPPSIINLINKVTAWIILKLNSLPTSKFPIFQCKIAIKMIDKFISSTYAKKIDEKVLKVLKMMPIRYRAMAKKTNDKELKKIYEDIAEMCDADIRIYKTKVESTDYDEFIITHNDAHLVNEEAINNSNKFFSKSTKENDSNKKEEYNKNGVNKTNNSTLKGEKVNDKVSAKESTMNSSNSAAIIEFKMSKKTDSDFKKFAEAVTCKPKTVKQAKENINDIIGMGMLSASTGTIINKDVIKNTILDSIKHMGPVINPDITKTIIKEASCYAEKAKKKAITTTDKNKSDMLNAVADGCSSGAKAISNKNTEIEESVSIQVEELSYEDMLTSMQTILEGMTRTNDNDIAGFEFLLYDKDFYKSIPLKDIAPVTTYIFGHFNTLDIDTSKIKTAMSDAAWDLRKLPRNKETTNRIFALSKASNNDCSKEELIDIEDIDAVSTYLNDIADGNKTVMESMVAVNELSISSSLKLGLDRMINTAKNADAKISIAANAVDNLYRIISQKITDSLKAENREAVIRGDILPSLSKCIKLACVSGALYVINPALALVAIVVRFVMSSKGRAKEKQLVLNELDVELTMIDKYIQDDEEKKDMKKLREHLLLKKKLQSQYARLKYNIKIEWNDTDVKELRGKENE